jgi:hypothetical protein
LNLDKLVSDVVITDIVMNSISIALKAREVITV